VNARKAMSKANSHGKGNGSVNGASETATTTVAGASTRHQRRARRNPHGGGADRDAAALEVAPTGDRSTTRDHAGTVASHSQATTTGQRRDQLLCPTRVLYENTYRIEPQVQIIGGSRMLKGEADRVYMEAKAKPPRESQGRRLGAPCWGGGR